MCLHYLKKTFRIKVSKTKKKHILKTEALHLTMCTGHMADVVPDSIMSMCSPCSPCCMTRLPGSKLSNSTSRAMLVSMDGWTFWSDGIADRTCTSLSSSASLRSEGGLSAIDSNSLGWYITYTETLRFRYCRANCSLIKWKLVSVGDALTVASSQVWNCCSSDNQHCCSFQMRYCCSSHVWYCCSFHVRYCCNLHMLQFLHTTLLQFPHTALL